MPTRKKFRKNNRKSRRRRKRGGEGEEKKCEPEGTAPFKKHKICPCPRAKYGKSGGTYDGCKANRTTHASYIKWLTTTFFKKEGPYEKETNGKEINKWFESPEKAKQIKELIDAAHNNIKTL